MGCDSFVIMKVGRLNTLPGIHAKVPASSAPPRFPRLLRRYPAGCAGKVPAAAGQEKMPGHEERSRRMPAPGGVSPPRS